MLLAWNIYIQLLRSFLITVGTRWIQCSEFQTSAHGDGMARETILILHEGSSGTDKSTIRIESVILGVTSPPKLLDP
jgi:hypothetical protein